MKVNEDQIDWNVMYSMCFDVNYDFFAQKKKNAYLKQNNKHWFNDYTINDQVDCDGHSRDNYDTVRMMLTFD